MAYPKPRFLRNFWYRLFVYSSKILGFAGKDILSELEDTARRLLQLRESADGGRDSD
jgi:hypothetical protein